MYFKRQLIALSDDDLAEIKENGTIEIPDDVTKIGQRCFMNAEGLKTIELPKSVQKVDAEAFLGCKDLETVIFNSYSVKLGEDAFKGCENIQRVSYPENRLPMFNYIEIAVKQSIEISPARHPDIVIRHEHTEEKNK